MDQIIAGVPFHGCAVTPPDARQMLPGPYSANAMANDPRVVFETRVADEAERRTRKLACKLVAAEQHVRLLRLQNHCLWFALTFAAILLGVGGAVMWTMR